MRLSFFGACRQVTGSNFLLEVGGKKILLDCGLFQGSKAQEKKNYQSFPYQASQIDAVIVGHAHLDHTGRLPKLTKDGFSGRIFATAPTKELTRLVLEDSEKLMREEAVRDNHSPFYSAKDIEVVMQLFESIAYGEKMEIFPGITLTFKNAGHILGSAVTILESQGARLVYTSDLGNFTATLLEPPEFIENGDIAICESTYGGRVHESIEKRTEKLSQILNSTIVANGVLLIPTFAIERTQELLHDIEHFCTSEGCQKPTFFLDSPLAEKVTKTFVKYPEFLSNKVIQLHKGNDFFGLERVKITTTVEQSKEINDAQSPKIIIAGSGMMTGGRILHHAKRYLSGHKNSLLIVGYQSQGTLGRRIFDGEKKVRILGEEVEIRAQIKSIGSYSAHADMPQLLEWLSKIGNLKRVFLVHGEADQETILAKEIESKLNIETTIPQEGKNYEL